MLAKRPNVGRRDDFSRVTIKKLAARSGNFCSNPDCRAATSGPQLEPGGTVNVGVASHISAAAPGGPRYTAILTAQERANIKNGIWLCQTCSKLVDSDSLRYTEVLLQSWKTAAEKEALDRIGKTRSTRTGIANAERELKRQHKIRDGMLKIFLKSPNRMAEELAKRDAPFYKRPSEKFEVGEAIIRRLGETTFPKVDDSSGINSWFKVELYDFYHQGLKVILGIESGALSLKNSSWAIVPYGSELDRTHFRPVKLWHIGKIPFANIRHCDTHSDGHYNCPHLHCTYNIDGMPYAGFEYLIIDENGDSEPLDPALKLESSVVLHSQTGDPVREQ